MDSVSAGISTLNVRGKTLDLSAPQIMGILNFTPDSFSDGGSFNSLQPALEQVERMISQGASIIDVGGESTRPGSDPVSTQEEIDRVAPVLEEAIPGFPDIFFSIDTTKYDVAEEALKLGTHLVNDISGLGREPRLAQLCAEYRAGYILMHSKGLPKVMQENPEYDDVLDSIHSFFEEKVAQLKQAGVWSVIIDPGFGFGKTQAHDVCILRNLDSFKDLGYPILAGASRKRMIGELLAGRAVTDRVTGTVVAHYHAMLKGAGIIRVHDVKPARDSILVYNGLRDR